MHAHHCRKTCHYALKFIYLALQHGYNTMQ